MNKTMDKDVLKQYIEDRLIVLESYKQRYAHEQQFSLLDSQVGRINELWQLADKFGVEIGE